MAGFHLHAGIVEHLITGFTTLTTPRCNSSLCDLVVKSGDSVHNNYKLTRPLSSVIFISAYTVITDCLLDITFNLFTYFRLKADSGRFVDAVISENVL